MRWVADQEAHLFKPGGRPTDASRNEASGRLTTAAHLAESIDLRPFPPQQIVR